MISYLFDDSSGTNNGILEPGEESNLIFTIKNVGSIDIQNLNGILVSASPYLEIINSSSSFGSVLIDSLVNNMSNPFRIQALSNAPQGYETFLKLILSDNSGSIDTTAIKIIIGKKDYLVWDADRNNSSGHRIYEILQNLGYEGDYINYHFYSFEHLQNYKSLFICAGVAYQNFVLFNKSYEVQKVVNYIEHNGNVYLEGGECWFFDPLVMSGFDFNPYFGIRPVNDGYSGIGTIEGIENTFTQGMLFRYEGEDFFLDQIDSTGTGFRIFYEHDNNFYCGVANIASGYKTVGVSFELSGLLDNEQVTKAILLDSIMHFFGINFVGIEKEQDVQFMVRNQKILTISPNPFRNHLIIKFEIRNPKFETNPKSQILNTKLQIYDATGRLVKSFNYQTIQPSDHPTTIVWNGTDDVGRKLPAGVYFVRLESEGIKQVEKVVKIE